MFSKSLKGLLVTAFSALLANAQDITSNTIDRGTISISLGNTHIYPDVYYSIIDVAVASFTGSFNNEGGFYLTSDSSLIALTASIVGTSITNSGDWAFNSIQSLTTPDFYLTATISFSNTGTMWFGGDGLGVPIMSVLGLSWENDGLMVFSLTTRSTGEVLLGAALGVGTQTITNEGTICLINQVYEQSTKIEGSGCIDIGEDSTVFLYPSTSLTFISSSHCRIAYSNL
ncbi:hypothetical protein CANTEDRAFT_135304 [Yamadazyma tenuis ATCC 10573]|uniref:Hyphally-regulated cell wall protein N-terminal domain-containing protein n=1 Tax=Candida tenuis (strain ATCC 10573 / BCRC 21748 / CBS 615 / JCM 9827 / NBRC 10315 / NRRL Y-1498 / VKM Y-70) TaxID=590646 RepID=G3B6L6_CANTC|nr:uncharacterized protein CANTEDRAFT_135304 [Yamadazyma tenuis ATCC 10573]EGV63498.1 hypothetical protein CANTEDRAFT_135304 [Yamadazyma tenuis ATCC 10573]